MEIRPLKESDLALAKAFTDRTIGDNYYPASEWADIFKRSQKDGVQCTLVLEDAGQIKGVRITYPPGNWQKGKGKGLSPQHWGVQFGDVAYFQSIFVDPELMGEGWGGKLSRAAIEILKTLNAKAIVTHSWKESPKNSSRKYLEGMGFKMIAAHPLYWHEVDYKCTRCGKPCMCTAEEMILKLDSKELKQTGGKK